MHNTTPWPPLMLNLLVYFRKKCGYNFIFIAEVLSREAKYLQMPLSFTKNSCVGRYNRIVGTRFKIDMELIKDYLPGKDDHLLEN